MDSSGCSSPVVLASSLCTHLDRDRLIRLAVVGDALEQVAADPGDDALLVALRLPHHRVRLAGARLAVGEDADVVACAREANQSVKRSRVAGWCRLGCAGNAITLDKEVGGNAITPAVGMR